ncbi:MAG: hypothetical protein HKN04_04805 [Rhodothermaceae bacterium]|nr:hypothetical protein [Rhodothermaceae bacterium]
MMRFTLSRVLPGRAVGLLLCGLLLCGCLRFGSTGSELTPAQSPHGAHVEVQAAEPVAGELLAARDEGLVLLAERRVVLVPFSALRAPSTIEGVVRLRPFTTPSMQDRERLRLLSRFPGGIPEGYLAQLLGDAGQTEIAVLR